MVLKSKKQYGSISAVIGSLIKVKGLENFARLHDLIRVSKLNILAETIHIYQDHIVCQCFENTSNLRINDQVISLNEPLSMELGPGLLGSTFDGIQRPLDEAFALFEDGSLRRGLELPSLSRIKEWTFSPSRDISNFVKSGDIIGTVQETQVIVHKIMVPPNIRGTLSYLASEGDYTIIDEIYRINIDGKEKSFSMLQKWPITTSRPFKERMVPKEPLITGMRVIDLLFPIAKGGTIGVPGGFGTGKTVIQQSLAKWCNADVLVYVGCGERGNEI
ncbi:hypothetical protein LCGC14_1712120, partial [marine sediment metagenome]